jgi:tetratricopeptide (TPR) repeat protein
MNAHRKNKMTLLKASPWKPSLILLLTLTAGVSTLLLITQPAFSQSVLDRYIQLQQNGSMAFSQGQLSQAVAAYEEALPIAPTQSLAAAHNNLAAAYLRRGKYFSNKEHNEAAALSDFRNAVFLLGEGWPEGIAKQGLHYDNTTIALQELKSAYDRLKIPNTGTEHLKLAKAFRADGQFRQAIVEYSQAASIDPSQVEALTGLGNLWQVLNRTQLALLAYKRAADMAGNQGGADTLWLNLATAYQKNNQLNEAVDALNHATDINPKNTTALLLLEHVWRDELQHNPNNVSAHANLARVFQNQQRYDLALQAYQNAERLAYNTPSMGLDVKKELRLNLASYYKETKNYNAAEQAYRSVLEIEPANPDALEGLASLFKEAQQPQKSIALYDAMLSKATPTQAPALHAQLLALIRELPGGNVNVEQALDAYGKRYARVGYVQASIGEVYHQAKRYAKAVSFYQAAVALEPKEATTWANLGIALHEMQNDEEALQALKRAQALAPNNTTVRQLADSLQSEEAFKQNEQGLSLLRNATSAREKEQALASLRQAAQSDPNSVAFGLGYVYGLQQMQRYGEALTEANRLASLEPNNPEIFYYRGTVFQQQNQAEKAVADFKKAIALKGNYPEAKEALTVVEEQQNQAALQQAIAAYQAKQPAKALSLFDLSLQKNPNNALAYYYKGLSLSDLKRLPEAAFQYEKAVALDATFQDAYYALALAYDELKNTAKAKITYEAYLKQTSTYIAGSKMSQPEAIKAKTQDLQPYVAYAAARLQQLQTDNNKTVPLP